MDKSAFEKFYAAHMDKVYRFVFFRVAQDKELAEDLVEEIFIKALENFAKYDPEKSRSAWILTIAKNHLANYWRGYKKVESIPEGEAEREGEADAIWFDSAKEKFCQESLKAEIYELLGCLEAREKEIVTLHYLNGYSYKEIAEALGMNESAVKVAAHRSIKKLSKLRQ